MTDTLLQWGESFVLLVEDAQVDKLEVQLFDGDKPKEPLVRLLLYLAPRISRG